MAQNLYAAASLNEKNRATYSATFNYPCAVNLQTNAAPATGCKPVDQYFNGSAVGFYNSTSVYDDLAWAATWLYKATNDPGYLSDAEKCATVPALMSSNMCLLSDFPTAWKARQGHLRPMQKSCLHRCTCMLM